MKRIYSLAIVVCILLTTFAVPFPLAASTTPNDSILDPSYRYAEPTLVEAPDSIASQNEEEEGEGGESGEQEEKKAEGYSFISNNIRVSATKGEIEAGTFSVKKGGTLTFTATKRIKGVVISGTVKESFTATTDKGQIEALFSDIEREAYPAVIVKDVNDTAVTITCNKKLICLYAQVYFYANPTEVIEGRTGEGDTTVIDKCDQVMAEYMPECIYDAELDSVIIKHHYQLYLTYNNGIDSFYTASIQITVPEKGQLSGTYAHQYGNLNPSKSFCRFSSLPNDFSVGVEGLLSLAQIPFSDKFILSGYLICRNNNFYYFQYNGEVPVITPEQGIEQTLSPSFAGKMFDLMGREVCEEYRGIVIRDGKKYIKY